MRISLVSATMALLAWGTARAQDSVWVREHYSKQELQIAMRDGVHLFTAIYTPRDTSRTYPIMLIRTPYGVAPYGADAYPMMLGPDAHFGPDGFIFVYQDVRGRYMSEGTYVNVRPMRLTHNGPQETDESTDTYDAIDWLIKNVAHNNGRVGMWGISYPGGYAEDALVGAHPALKAVSPQAPVSDWGHGDDWHDNGTFRLPHAYGFYAGFDRPRDGPTTTYGPRPTYPTPDGYEFYLNLGSVANADKRDFHGSHPAWTELLEHPNYDAYWKARNLLTFLKNVSPAVMTVGGWFDNQNLYGALHVYQAIEAQSPSTTNSMVFGPWFHGGWARSDGDALGNERFGAKQSFFYRDSIEFPFFAHYLKDAQWTPLPKAFVFQTGSNVWQRLDAWPPKGVSPRALYLQPDGGLTYDPPRNAAKTYDQYVSDPARPVPYTMETAIGMTSTYVTEDQRFAARRPDVVVFTGPVLGKDVTVSGPIQASIWVSTSGTDSDWLVKVIDVYPDSAKDPPGLPAGFHYGGFQQLVRADAMRARFRKSFEHPEPMVPGQPTKLEFTLNDINHDFQPGHRIMIQIQSTWFPIMDRNTQNYVPNIELANDSDFHVATERVYHSAQYPSKITVLVAPEYALAPNH
jgi:uncharacterized protein